MSTGFTFQDVGGCNCCLCTPCPLPGSPLTVTGNVAGNAFSGTLAFLGGCAWFGCYFAFGTTWEAWNISCLGGCTYFERSAGLSCATLGNCAVVESTPGCSGLPCVQPLFLISHSCSPLVLTFNSNALGLGNSWIITP